MADRKKRTTPQLALGADIAARTYRPGDMRQFFGRIKERKLEGEKELDGKKVQLVQAFDFSEPYQPGRLENVRATYSIEHLLNPELRLGDRLSTGDLHFYEYRSTIYHSYNIREKRNFVGLPWGTVLGKDSSSRIFGARLFFYKGRDELILDVCDWGFKLKGDFGIKNVMPKGTTEESARHGIIGRIGFISSRPEREIIRDVGERLWEFYEQRIPWDFRGWAYDREQKVDGDLKNNS